MRISSTADHYHSAIVSPLPVRPLTTKEQTRMMQKRVRFGETTKVFLPNLSLTNAERSDLWFSKDELKSFRQSSTFYSAALSLRTQQVRKRYIHYALQAQAASRRMGMDDATGLAAIAAARSKSDVEKAFMRAAKDAATAADETEATAHRNQKAALTSTRKAKPDNLKPTQCQGRIRQVAIRAPRRHRTVAHMA
jgi:hypothetical protein